MMQERARTYLEEMSRTAARTAEACAADVARGAEVLINSLLDGGKILLCGNGGSAADCQHLAAEFVSALFVLFVVFLVGSALIGYLWLH